MPRQPLGNTPDLNRIQLNTHMKLHYFHAVAKTISVAHMGNTLAGVAWLAIALSIRWEPEHSPGFAQNQNSLSRSGLRTALQLFLLFFQLFGAVVGKKFFRAIRADRMAEHGRGMFPDIALDLLPIS